MKINYQYEYYFTITKILNHFNHSIHYYYPEEKQQTYN